MRPHTLRYNGVDLSGWTTEPPPLIFTIADAVSPERWALRAEIDRVRDELGVPRVFFPGAPDGRNSWEGEPAPIWDAVVAEMGAPL